MAVTAGISLRDYLWAVVAVVFAGLAVLNVVAFLYFLLGGDFGALLPAPVSLLFTYWIGMGAWRRTVWGRPADATATTNVPALSAARSRRLILFAMAAAIALVLALALQVLAGRS